MSTKSTRKTSTKSKATKVAKPRGIDAVFTLVARNPQAKVDTVLKKAREIGVKPSGCSNNQIKALYRIAHKAQEVFTACGKM